MVGNYRCIEMKEEALQTIKSQIAIFNQLCEEKFVTDFEA